jgi:hypothetical protein
VRQQVGRRDYLELAARTGLHPVPPALFPRAGSFWRCMTCAGFGGSVVGTTYGP